LGSDLRELGAACSQLAADVVGGKMIDDTDVLKFQNGRIETTGFDVADAALDGKRDIALIALRNALATGTDPVLITSALAGSLRTLAKVSGASRGVKSFELAGPLGLVVAVAQADADIKGAAVDPIHSLERAIIAITSRV
jgi:DNA polymerase-3 subunit delta